MADDKHRCDACPVEVRGLYAAAHNAHGAWSRGDSPSRIAHKMDELAHAIARIAPIVEAHFAGLDLRTGERRKDIIQEGLGRRDITRSPDAK